MLPKPPKLSPRSPTWRYLGPSWSQLAPNLAPTSPILRPSSSQPAEKFFENRAQDAKRCPEISQDHSRTRFWRHQPPPGTPKYQKNCCFPTVFESFLLSNPVNVTCILDRKDNVMTLTTILTRTPWQVGHFCMFFDPSRPYLAHFCNKPA